jgi:hypothetical protein
MTGYGGLFRDIRVMVDYDGLWRVIPGYRGNVGLLRVMTVFEPIIIVLLNL